MSGHALKDVEGFKRRVDMFYVDPYAIHVVDGWNPRTDFSGEDDLMASIIENGVEVPLKVRKVENPKSLGSGYRLELVDGERRLRATLRAVANGHEIQVPVQLEKRGTNEIDSLVGSLIRNDGKPLSAVEESEAYRRLSNWGLKADEIAKKVGKSVSHIRNRLELSGASPAVKESVSKGEIPIGTAQEIAKNPSIEKQQEDLRQRKSAPKIRAATIGYRNGSLYRRGEGDKPCGPIVDFLRNTTLRELISSAGYDPDTLKISIKRRS